MQQEFSSGDIVTEAVLCDCIGLSSFQLMNYFCQHTGCAAHRKGDALLLLQVCIMAIQLKFVQGPKNSIHFYFFLSLNQTQYLGLCHNR